MKGYKNEYTCPLCGFKGSKHDVYWHIHNSHFDYLSDKCKDHGEDINDENTKYILICRILNGNSDFEICHRCGHAILSKTSSGRRQCGYCGLVPQNEYWKSSFRDWLDSDDSKDHRNQAREMGKRTGPVTGKQNLINYNNTHKEDLSKRGRYYGKINGPKNFYDYNHNPKYRDIRKKRAEQAGRTKSSNPRFLINSAKSNALISERRRSGEADLYIIMGKDPKKGTEICKVGYSRDFLKFRKWAYIDFSVTKALICRLPAEDVLNFEKECQPRFSHYWMNWEGVPGKTEWYWGKEHDDIVKLAESKGYQFSEYDVTFD